MGDSRTDDPPSLRAKGTANSSKVFIIIIVSNAECLLCGRNSSGWATCVNSFSPHHPGQFSCRLCSRRGGGGAEGSACRQAARLTHRPGGSAPGLHSVLPLRAAPSGTLGNVCCGTDKILERPKGTPEHRPGGFQRMKRALGGAGYVTTHLSASHGPRLTVLVSKPGFALPSGPCRGGVVPVVSVAWPRVCSQTQPQRGGDSAGLIPVKTGRDFPVCLFFSSSGESAECAEAVTGCLC